MKQIGITCLAVLCLLVVLPTTAVASDIRYSRAGNQTAQLTAQRQTAEEVCHRRRREEAAMMLAQQILAEQQKQTELLQRILEVLAKQQLQAGLWPVDPRLVPATPFPVDPRLVPATPFPVDPRLVPATPFPTNPGTVPTTPFPVTPQTNTNSRWRLLPPRISWSNIQIKRY